MKRIYYTSLISALLLCISFSNPIFAQDFSHYWSFTFRILSQGGSYNGMKNCIESSKYDTKALCERKKKELSKKVVGFDIPGLGNATGYYAICTDCKEHGATNTTKYKTENTNSTYQSSSSKSSLTTEEAMQATKVIIGGIGNGFYTAKDRHNSYEERKKRDKNLSANTKSKLKKIEYIPEKNEDEENLADLRKRRIEAEKKVLELYNKYD
jgi:hypothetical protein